MKDDREFRSLIHSAVDAYGASAREHPMLRERVLQRANRKERPPMKKKLSTAAILLIVLLLATLTAIAVGLTVEEMWAQSFERMNTRGYVHSASDETQAEISMEEAIAIARAAIISKYGTPEAELDAMGVYPGYFQRGWDGKTDDYPSEWDVYFSSRTDVDIDEDHLDYGPTGEYRVYINAETKEVTYCHWYTNDFWSRAQTIWNCGSYDEVYWWYGRPSFWSLPADKQAWWTSLLSGAGYDVVTGDEKLHAMLLSAATDLQFQSMDAFADESDPLVAAAWAEMERLGFDAETLRRYAYVATLPDWQTGTDNVCIHYSYEKDFDLIQKGFLDPCSAMLFSRAHNFGLYMFSFEPGTTDLVSVTHVTRAEDIRQEPITHGLLLDRNAWGPEDLAEFDGAFQRLDMGVKRMRAAGLDEATMQTLVNGYLHRYGGTHQAAPEGVDVDSWFADESEWDALVEVPGMSYEEFTTLYGSDERFWPMEVLCQLDPRSYRMPHPGETTLEEAMQYGLEAIFGVSGEELQAITAGYEVFVRRVTLTGDPDAVDCRWEVYVVRDHNDPVDGFRVHWGEWEDRKSTPTVQDITDRGNG